MRIESLLINSGARLNPTRTTTSDFKVNVSPSVSKVVGTRLGMCVIENGFYFPVDGSLTITIGTGAAIGLTIPKGYYDDLGISYLMTTLINQVNPPSTPQSTFFVQITNEGFLQVVNDTTNNWTISFKIDSAPILGFTTMKNYTPTGTNSPFIVQSDRSIRIPSTTYLFLQSEALGNNISDSLGFASFKSIVSGTSGTQKGSNDIIYENPIPFDTLIKSFRSGQTLSQVDITLKDIYGMPVPLNTGNNIILQIDLLIDE